MTVKYILKLKTDGKNIIKITDDPNAAIADISKKYKIRGIISIERMAPASCM